MLIFFSHLASLPCPLSACTSGVPSCPQCQGTNVRFQESYPFFHSQYCTPETHFSLNYRHLQLLHSNLIATPSNGRSLCTWGPQSQAQAQDPTSQSPPPWYQQILLIPNHIQHPNPLPGFTISHPVSAQKSILPCHSLLPSLGFNTRPPAQVLKDSAQCSLANRTRRTTKGTHMVQATSQSHVLLVNSFRQAL